MMVLWVKLTDCSLAVILFLIINNVVLRQLPLLQTILVLHRQQVHHSLVRKYQKSLDKQGTSTPAVEARGNTNPGSVGVWSPQLNLFTMQISALICTQQRKIPSKINDIRYWYWQMKSSKNKYLWSPVSYYSDSANLSWILIWNCDKVVFEW